MTALEEIRNILWENGISPTELCKNMPGMYPQKLYYILNHGMKISHNVYTDIMKALNEMGVDVDQPTPRLNLVGKCNRINENIVKLQGEIIAAEADAVIDDYEKKTILHQIKDIRDKLTLLEKSLNNDSNI